MSGMVLFCVYGRSRWSDSQHAENLLPDFDNQGKTTILGDSIISAQDCKGFSPQAHASCQLRPRPQGLLMTVGVEQWMQVREMLRISMICPFTL